MFACGLTLLARTGERDHRIRPEREQLLFPGEAVGEPPQFGAALLHKEIESAAVGKLVCFALGLGVADDCVRERHGFVFLVGAKIPTAFSIPTKIPTKCPAARDYARTDVNASSAIALFLQYFRRVRTSANMMWCPGAESNHRHRDFQSRALPTELPGRRAGPDGPLSKARAL